MEKSTSLTQPGAIVNCPSCRLTVLLLAAEVTRSMSLTRLTEELELTTVDFFSGGTVKHVNHGP